MKKFNIAILSILTILLTSILVGCDFKDVKASFKETKISFSLNEPKSLDLKKYLEVSGAGIDEISFELENPDLFYLKGSVITPLDSGKSKVYATYQKNCLATMDLVVKQPLASPTNLRVEENDGKTYLTWNKVFVNDKNQVLPVNRYEIKGERVVYSKDNMEDVETSEEILEVCEDVFYELK